MSENPQHDLSVLVEQQKRLLSEMAHFRGDIASLTVAFASMRVDVMSRIDRVQNSVNALRDDISVNYFRSRRVENVATTTTEEVRSLAEEVNAMERQIMRLRAEVDELKNAP